jgi:hypothetical protein
MTLVVSIMAMIGLAVNQSVVNGIKLWDFTRQFSVEEDVFIFLDRLGLDLRNAFPLAQFAFDGTEENVAFPTVIRTRQDRMIAGHPDDYCEQIGRVEYVFDKAKRTITRRQANYSQALQAQFGPERVLAAPVEGLKFSYLYSAGEEFAWEEEGRHFPAAVRVEIKIKEYNGDIRVLSRLLDIPLSGT